jgi:hypothetical protein
MREGVFPECRPCLFPLDAETFSFTSHGGNASRGCSALCRAGFHSIGRVSGVYLQEPVNVFELACVACKPGDTRACHEKCVVGSYRNTSVASALAEGACVVCRKSSECKRGYYAAVCTGNETANSECVPCARGRLLSTEGVVVKEFAPYELMRDPERSTLMSWLNERDCPTVCLPNHVQVEGGECTTCAQWTKAQGCEQADGGGQPAPCDFVFSHWNATRQAAWWDVARFTPSFLKGMHLEQGVPVNRAGVCWACPYGEGTIEGDVDLCMLLPGYGRTIVESRSTPGVKIPVWGNEVFLSMQEPTVKYLDAETISQRRLLVSGRAEHGQAVVRHGAERAMLQAKTDNMPCVYGHYKSSRGEGRCSACPYGTSTTGTGARSVYECVCLPGWTRNREGCTPCPIDTYLPSLTTGACRACPARETTFGRSGSTACACQRGWMRVGTQCAPCPANGYCRPCGAMEKCPSSRVIVTPCFAGAYSKEGSVSINNCTCAEGSVVLRRANGDLYCSKLPPRAFFDARTGRAACEAGWTAEWDGLVLKACALCPRGQFAPLSETQGLLSCRVCPRGFYTGTQDTIGRCTPCGEGLTTAREGSVSIRDCTCPPPTVAKDGGCFGCTDEQYSENGVCKACPAFSKSPIGAR